MANTLPIRGDSARGGDWDGAIGSFQSALELNPQSFWSYHKLGESFLKLEQWQKAVITYEKAIANRQEL